MNSIIKNLVFEKIIDVEKENVGYSLKTIKTSRDIGDIKNVRIIQCRPAHWDARWSTRDKVWKFAEVRRAMVDIGLTVQLGRSRIGKRQ